MTMTRRDVMSTMGVGAAVLAAETIAEAKKGGAAAAPAMAPLPTSALPVGQHQPVPLPFDAKKLVGISEKLITSHHDNNYAGAVKNLNKVEQQLAQVTKDTDGFVVFGLKERELTYSNSVILHEHYFGNLGGDGKSSGDIAKALAAAYGSMAAWEEQFRAVGASLGGGSGWTVLDWNLHTNELRTYWSGGHSQALSFAVPLLVLDMYEHAYQMDYGAEHKKYIDAFFQNINWDEVNHRLARAQKAAAALKA